MNYEKYELKDFVLDDYFIQWVRYPDAQSDLFWESWIARHPGKKNTIEEAKRIISSIKFKEDRLNEREVVDMWKNLDPEQRFLQEIPQTRLIPQLKPIHWQRVAAVFAGFALLAAFTLMILKWQSADEGRMTRYTTGYGQTKTIVLPDGSEVVLNANSSLRHSLVSSSDSVRQVWLDGEAFFSVTHQAENQKFVVHSSGIDIQVLGTEFNVNNRRAKVRVVLNTGKVTLQDQHKLVAEEIVMKPGELVEIEEGRSKYSRKRVNTEVYTSWKKNKLIFDGTPLIEIAQILEDNYGYKVIIEDSLLAGKQFKGTVPANEIDNLLGQIEKVFDADIRKNDRQIIMKLNSD